MTAAIRYLNRSEIDDDRWNDCVARSGTALLYAQAGYLDRAARQWAALVVGDYEYVMPLTYNRKWGLYYAYQPLFCACLGVFGREVNPQLVQAFREAIPNRFRLVEIDLNAKNYFNQHGEAWITRNNYTLSLATAYDQLFKNYRETHRRNIKRCADSGCRYSTGLPLHELLVLIQTHAGEEKNLSRADAERFTQLYQWLQQQNRAEIAAVHAPEGTLLSAAAFFTDGQRWYYILAGNHPDGRSMGSSHYLVDRFVASRAGEPALLDFEGSDLQGVAFFYSGFGASLEHYPALRISKLPGWMRVVRRMVKGER